MGNLWFIPAIMSIFGGVGEYKAGKEMEQLAAQQELLAQENEQLAKRELDENVRRQDLKDKRVKGTALARAAGSGARVEGSAAEYLDYLDAEQGRQLDWMKEAGASRIRINKQSSLLEAQGTRIQAKSKKLGLYSSGIQALGFLGQGGFLGGPKTS